MKKSVSPVLLIVLMFLLHAGKNTCFCQPFNTGTVIDTVRLLTSRSESYALLLPPAYNTRSHWPVIYFFEPLGRGSLPLQTYKDLATEHGFIMISSNNCRNGSQAVMEPMAERLFEDTKERFNIDTGHIYCAGFSGGSKLAFRLALKNHFIHAVIGCGACYPVSGLSKNSIPFIYSGIIGTSDMNYYPMRQNMDILEGMGIPYYLISFEGSHTWPPPQVFNEALWWTMIRDSLKGKNDYAELYSLMATAVQSALKEKAYYRASLRAAEMKKIFANTRYSIPADSILQMIIQDPSYALQIKKLNRITKTEAAFQDEIYYAFLGILHSRYNQIDTVHTSSWWRSQHRQCNRLIASKDPEKHKLGKRMDGLIVTSAFEQGAAFMSENDYKQSITVYNILILFRPESWYGYQQLALCYKGLNQPQKAEKYMEMARKKGLEETRETNSGRQGK
jgi:hypothetical protein